MNATELVGWTQRIIDACGARPAGSDSCRKAAELIASDLRLSCDRTDLQSFVCRPLSFIWHRPLLTPIALAAAVCLFGGHFLTAALALFVVAGISAIEFGRYRELTDGLFPQRRCTNVVGIIEPKGPAVRQIVVSAHHDSAYEFLFLRMSKLVYILAVAVYGVAVYLVPLVAVALAFAVMWHIAVPVTLAHGLAWFTGLGAVVGLLFVLPRAVPGAGDNLISTAMLVGLAAAIRQELTKDADALHGTRLIVASFDAEEAGLRGSRAFVRDNRDLLKALPTVNINLDSFFHVDSLSALLSDLNGFVQLSKPLADLMAQEAKAEHLPFSTRQMQYGFGATDAAEFAKIGIPATTLISMSPNPFHPKHLVYHTRNDIPENLEHEAVAAGATLTLRMVKRLGRDDAAHAFGPGADLPSSL